MGNFARTSGEDTLLTMERRLISVVTIGAGGIAGKPAAAERAHLLDDWNEREPALCKGVLYARRNLGEAVPLDDVGFFEPLEALGERLWADSDQRSFEFAEPAATVGEVAHDQRRPLVADELRGACNRTAETFGRLAVGYDGSAS